MKTGYEVHYTLKHSGFDRSVYWSEDYEECRNYARLILKNHGRTHGVYISHPDESRVRFTEEA